jgi:glutamate-ammonia-ligase adenylyltransferase
VGRLGLIDAAAGTRLTELGWDNETHVELLWSLSRAPDADFALHAVLRLAEALGDRWSDLDAALLADRSLRGRLFAVLGSSLAFGDHLAANPQSWKRLAGEVRLPTYEAVRQEFSDCIDEFGPSPTTVMPKLRCVYRDQLMVLAALDLAPTVENEPVLQFSTVGAHLSDLADAALDAALQVAVANVCKSEPPPRLAVIAMGKCGARELNYVSDVDIIFVGEDADALTTRVAGEMMRLASEAFFEVDAALRPEGKAGALVRTLESHIAYYQRWAKTWEFQALLKARACIGDAELGRRYIDALTPMVWTACEREDFVPEVQAMRRRVESLVPAEVREREIKLGAGGLRDVEFAVQLLQLVHGRTDRSMHVASTVDALAALGSGGYVGRDDAANLTASYEFLRLLEHRLQLQRLKRTHLLPAPGDDEALRWLARAAHVRPDGTRDAVGVLREELKRQNVRVSKLHAKLFYQPLLESVGSSVGFTHGMSADAAERQLAALGYEVPQSALTHLGALVNSSGRRGRVQAVLLPRLLEWLSDTPDPDSGLLAYRRVSEVLSDHRWYLSTLRDESAVAKRLMRVLGTSAFVPELLMRAPEVIQSYADGPTGPKLLDVEPDGVARALIASAGRHPDPPRAIAAARTLRRRELARVASADLLGMLDVEQVCTALSSVWVAVLQCALETVIRANTPPGGTAPAAIAVIGMGRLGGGELGYGSDADVMFVCEPVAGLAGEDEAHAVKWSVNIAEQLRALLGSPSDDPPLEVDANLRPEGRSGPLVRTLSSYAAYYQQWAQPWEVQALLRARPVAGDAGLGARFVAIADAIRYPAGGISPDSVREIRRIKARVDAERLPRGADPNTHTKLGRGGLADVEWTVQLLQLRHAHEVPALRETSTLKALDVIGEAGLIPDEDVAQLRDAWLTATRARNALVLVRGRPTDQLPGPGRQLNAVAAAAGWPDGNGGEFLDNYLRVTRRAKAVVSKVFGS